MPPPTGPKDLKAVVHEPGVPAASYRQGQPSFRDTTVTTATHTQTHMYDNQGLLHRTKRGSVRNRGARARARRGRG